MPQQPTKGDKQTLIEQGTEFKGTMKSTCPVVVGTTVVYSDNSHMSATWSTATRRLLADELGRVSPVLRG